MIICHISSMHPVNDGRIFQRACVGLALRKVDTILIATNPRNEKVMGVRVIGLKERSGLRRRIFSSFEAFRKALKTKADIFHFHDPDLIPWMLFLLLYKKNVVFDLHENYESRISKFPRLKVVQKISLKVFKTFETIIYNRFNGLIVTTQSMKNNLRKIKVPVVIIDNAVFLERMKEVRLAPQRSNNITIYTSGNNTPARNCFQAIEAFSMVTQHFPEVKMIFGGRYYPPGYKEQLMQKAADFGLSDKVEFLGMVEWEENFTRTSAHHIGCVFYEDNANNRVTLPNRLYEYMYCGLAILGENFTEVRGVIDKYHCGVTVNSSDPGSIAEKMIYLLNNPDLIRKMGDNGRKAVFSKCNYEEALDRLIDFYNVILN